MKWERPAARTAKKATELAEQDDLLGARAERKLQGFYAIAFGASLYVWDVAFSLGSHGTIFYYRRHDLFVLCLVVVLSVVLLRGRVYTHPWLVLLLLPPIVLVVQELVVVHPGVLARASERILSIAALAVVPIVARVVGGLLAPEYFRLPGRRIKLTVIAIIAVVALIGFVAGRANNRYMTCEDFIIAGDDPPKNCARHVER
ncbi:MAG TPA: hypothetical protein VNS46_11840 [Nocardioides sp.]|nr:hypothetical protein [Nocardioides sp.]